jgi:methionyl-tRNA synthetase
MGKDNIPFHTVIWPSMLLGYGNLNLPYDVPANEYLNLEEQKISTSRNWAIWLPDYLDRHEPDPLRYVLASNMPETSDSDFTWREYVRANNDELVATYGNLVHRVLTMSYRNFGGAVPNRGELDADANEMLATARQRFDETGDNIAACRFRAGLSAAMSLAQATNRYLDRKEPWKAMREDRRSAATTLWVSLAVINCLKTALYPVLPFSSARLHAMLGLDGDVEDQGWSWDPEALVGSSRLQNPEPLFVKLDESIIEEESHRIGR